MNLRSLTNEKLISIGLDLNKKEDVLDWAEIVGLASIGKI